VGDAVSLVDWKMLVSRILAFVWIQLPAQG